MGYAGVKYAFGVLGMRSRYILTKLGERRNVHRFGWEKNWADPVGPTFLGRVREIERLGHPPAQLFRIQGKGPLPTGRLTFSPKRAAQSLRISFSKTGRTGLATCARSVGIRPVRCRKTAAECL